MFGELMWLRLTFHGTIRNQFCRELNGESFNSEIEKVERKREEKSWKYGEVHYLGKIYSLSSERITWFLCQWVSQLHTYRMQSPIDLLSNELQTRKRSVEVTTRANKHPPHLTLFVLGYLSVYSREVPLDFWIFRETYWHSFVGSGILHRVMPSLSIKAERIGHREEWFLLVIHCYPSTTGQENSQMMDHQNWAEAWPTQLKLSS